MKKPFSKIGLWFIMPVCVLGIVVLVHPVQASYEARTILRSDALSDGYTLRNAAGTFLVGIQGGTVNGVKKVPLEIWKINKPQRFPTKQANTIISDAYGYQIGKSQSRHITLNNKVWITLSYPANYNHSEKVIKYWDAVHQKWKPLQTIDDQNTLQVKAAVQRKSAIMAVFVKPVTLGKHIVEGQASWYHGSGAACNDFPLGSTIRVYNRNTGKHVDTVVVSTGPFVPGRVVDLTKEDFAAIADPAAGVADVKVRLIK